MSKSGYTISESFVLPSKGLIYDTPFDPNVTLRSMTTAEEMKRLTQTDVPYKVMSEIIEDCMTTKIPVRVYDLCLGDYQFLLHKLRVVTYGPEYKMTVFCPNCGETSTTVINLDSIPVTEYDESFEQLKKVHLPQSDKEVELRVQTPRMIDDVNNRTRDLKKKLKEITYEPGLIITLESIIKTVDGQVLNPGQLEAFVKKLPMRDVNIILQAAKKLNGKVGLDTEVTAKCGQCGYELVTTFRFTSEFFGPSID